MSKEVKRWSPDTNGRMREWPEGDYATWDDYDALRTELTEANADFVRIANEREALLAERDALKKDAERLDRLDIECEAYGCEGIHEGNRWMIDGPFRTVRDAIDAALQGDQL